MARVLLLLFCLTFWVGLPLIVAQVPSSGQVTIGFVAVDFLGDLSRILNGLLGGNSGGGGLGGLLGGLTGSLTGTLQQLLGNTWNPTDPFVQQGGTGCRKGTVGATIAIDNSFMTLIFDDFRAMIGPSAANNQRRTFCRVLVQIINPAGYQFAVHGADYRGYYQLDQGVSAEIQASYQYGGDLLPKTNSLLDTIQGPAADDILVHQNGASGTTLLPRPCSRNTTTYLQMSLAVTLSARSRDGSGIFQTDSADGSFKQNLGLSWKRC